MSESQELVHGLADGQLVGEDKAKALELVQNDPQANAEYQWALYLKEALPKSCRPVEDPAVWSTCKARLRDIERARRTDHFVGKYAWALSLGVLCVILFAGVQTRIHGAQKITGTQMAGLFGSFRPLAGAEDNGTASSRIQQALPGAPVLTIPRGVALSRVDEARLGDGRAAARLMMQDAHGVFAVILLENVTGIEGLQAPPPGSYVAGSLNNMPCVATRKGNYAVIVSGLRQTQELVAIGESVTGG